MKTHKKHYWVGTILVRYRNADGEEGNTPMNVLLARDASVITKADLDVLQRGALQQFHERFQPKDIEIFDAVIQGIHYCGHMTETTFYGETKPAPVISTPASPNEPGLIQ